MKEYEIGLYYDGYYKVARIKGCNKEDAIERLESKINTAKEYEIMHIRELV